MAASPPLSPPSGVLAVHPLSARVPTAAIAAAEIKERRVLFM
jgi:hypothetical protein